MNKFKSKKGFTLAELLIVVAIIAVLVAIAVPLFVAGLNKAQTATKNANIRAVRGVAVEKILTEESLQKSGDTIYDQWAVTAIVNGNGDITYIKITPSDADTPTAADGKCETLDADDSSGGTGGKKGDYKITMTLIELKLS